ncbi:unnamed protein product [Rotaria sp. Silwood2]|nr:unnamed protein product [Rotaria sp. Silwood2]
MRPNQTTARPQTNGTTARPSGNSSQTSMRPNQTTPRSPTIGPQTSMMRSVGTAESFGTTSDTWPIKGE